MTVQQIITELKPEKPISRETFYSYCRRFKIKPLGVRQRPQLYPADTVMRLRIKLGLNGRVSVSSKISRNKSNR